MNDQVVLQLSQLLVAQGNALLQDPAKLEQLLNQTCSAFPGKVKALVTLLDKKAVTYLSNWANEQQPNKLSFEQVRDGLAKKFADAQLMNASAAAWAVEAWAIALGYRTATASSPTAAVVAPAQAASPAAPVASAAGGSAPSQPRSGNVYAPPAARVEDPGTVDEEGETFIEGGRTLGAGRGWGWLAGGWNLFKQDPGIWIVNLLIFVGISIVLNIVPFVGGLLSFLLNGVFLGGMMIGAEAQRRGESLEVGHLFAGFKQNAGGLVVLGLLYMAALIAIVLVGVGIIGFSTFSAAVRGNPDVWVKILLAGLVILALSIPVMMAYIYAPALIALRGMGAGAAMKCSFLGSIRNIVPGLVYGVLLFVFAVLATIPLGLGWLVLGPVVTASVYASYRDVFYES
jgi:hypothetical protein